MKRFLAVLGAGAMIGFALLIRGVFIDGDGVDLGGDDGGGGGSGEVHAVCATELEDACQEMADQDDDFTFDVEDAGATAERLAAGDTDFDAWVTFNSWPELLTVRQVEGVLGEPSEVLASTRLALIGPQERMEALEAEDCTAWKCLGEIAGEPWSDHGGESSWGSVNVGHADPSQTAAGLLILGQAASDYFGRTDFARNDFDQGFRTWLRQLETADPGLPNSSGTPLEQLIQIGASSWDAVGDLDTADRRDNLTVLYPSPMIRGEVVVAPVAGAESTVDTDTLTEALETAGFDRGAGDGEAGPSAGVYEALLGEWELTKR